MPDKQTTPILDRISILAAAIMLAYTLVGFINFPERAVAIQLPGVYFEIEVNAQVIVAVLIAGLTATGADGLVRQNPAFDGKGTIQHWLVPALTAWALGMILIQQPFGPLWWIVFLAGSPTLILVLIAEYIIVSPADPRRIPATIGITSITFALFLTLAIIVRAIDTRLFLFVPAVSIAYLLTNLRIFHIRLDGNWAVSTALVNTFIIAQISAALHYFPIDPITFGLLILGPAYGLTTITSGLLESKRWQQMIAEPTIAVIIAWGTALTIG